MPQQTPRVIVTRTLEFDAPQRVPRQLWYLPWAETNFPQELKALQEDFPTDIIGVGGPEVQPEPSPTQGDMYGVGEYIDEWGVHFIGVHAGVHGEVKEPVIQDWDTDIAKVRFPEEQLRISPEGVAKRRSQMDKFIMSANVARPFERMQFLRGTENLFMDLALEEPRCLEFMQRLHHFNLDRAEAWAKTDVDGIMFMDDWGSQKALLISPQMWRDLFKPMYADYIRVAHDHGKKAFMHSDGCIVDIIPDLIELGLDALNSQIFCMGVEMLGEKFAGRITFWGEMDRQHILPNGTPDDVRAAVGQAYGSFWKNGGAIAQCEFGPGCKPENVRAMFDAWNKMAT